MKLLLVKSKNALKIKSKKNEWPTNSLNVNIGWNWLLVNYWRAKTTPEIKQTQKFTNTPTEYT